MVHLISPSTTSGSSKITTTTMSGPGMGLVGAQGGSSVTSRTTTTRTTTTSNDMPIITTTSGGGMSPIRTIGGYTTYTTGPSYVSSAGPMLTQYTTTTTSGGGMPSLLSAGTPSLLTGGTPSILTAGTPSQIYYTTSGLPATMGLPTTTGFRSGMPVGTLSTMPWSPLTQITPTLINTPTTTGSTTTTMTTQGGGATAVSSPSAPMMLGSMQQAREASGNSHPEAPSFSTTSSIDINGVHCEGRLEITNNKITRAKNMFLGTSPFVLDTSALQVTPELAVMTVHPDIKLHVADVPCGEYESLSLQQLKEMIPGHEGSVFLALPGQQAVLLDSLFGTAMNMGGAMGGPIMGIGAPLHLGAGASPMVL